jgi:hypothetical protein
MPLSQLPGSKLNDSNWRQFRKQHSPIDATFDGMQIIVILDLEKALASMCSKQTDVSNIICLKLK